MLPFESSLPGLNLFEPDCHDKGIAAAEALEELQRNE
jgi:hypothetical protein